MRFVVSLVVLAVTGVLAVTAVRSLAARLGPVEVYRRSGAAWLQIAVVGAGAAVAAFTAGATVLGWLLLGAAVLCGSCVVAAVRRGPQPPATAR